MEGSWGLQKLPWKLPWKVAEGYRSYQTTSPWKVPGVGSDTPPLSAGGTEEGSSSTREPAHREDGTHILATGIRSSMSCCPEAWQHNDHTSRLGNWCGHRRSLGLLMPIQPVTCLSSPRTEQQANSQHGLPSWTRACTESECEQAITLRTACRQPHCSAPPH